MHLNWLPPTDPIKLSQCCKFSLFFSVYCHIVYFCCIIRDLWFGMRRHYTQCQLQNKEVMLFAALGSPLGKRVSDHCSIFATEAEGFYQELLPSWVQGKLQGNAEISRISMIYTVQIEIYLRKENCNFISTQDITREHGSAIRKLSFSFTHPTVEGNK